MNVIAYDEYINPEYTKNVEYVNADVISLHCPLLESTKEIINKNSIAKMKNGVIIINTLGGPLINEDDLIKGLDSGKEAWAVMDVFSNEPPSFENKLVEHERNIVTPHIAWTPRESRKRLMDYTEENLTSFLSGNPINIVNR